MRLRTTEEILKNLNERYPTGHTQGTVTCSIPGDERIADELLKLYLKGLKWAGSSLKRAYYDSATMELKEPLPRVGDVWLIQGSDKVVRALARVIEVEEFVFDAVPERLAKAEGEGDRTIRYWKEAHRYFFEPYFEEFKIENLGSEIMIAEYFDVFRYEDETGVIEKIARTKPG